MSICWSLVNTQVERQTLHVGAKKKSTSRKIRRQLRKAGTAGKSDISATLWAARFSYWRHLKHGIRPFEYQPTKLHTKLIVIDDAVHIGSANFDMRSLYLNLEMMLRVDDPEFAATMRAYIDTEVARSREIEPRAHRKDMTILNRLRWAFGYFLMVTADYNLARRLNLGSRRATY